MYLTKDPKRDHNFDNHPDIGAPVDEVAVQPRGCCSFDVARPQGAHLTSPCEACGKNALTEDTGGAKGKRVQSPTVRVCVCVCVYCVCTYVCMYACMYVCMYACMHVCMYVCIYVYIRLHTLLCLCVCDTHLCLHACIHAHMYVCAHACE